MSTVPALKQAISQSYADFRAEQAARGRPVCDAFEPCKAARTEPHPWSDAPEFTPCGRCGWSKRTHDDGTITIKAQVEATVNICTPHVATLPDGSRVALPAGTVLREGTLPPEIGSDAWINSQFREVTQAEGEALLADLTERMGLPREMAPSVEPAEPRTLGEQLHEEHERTAHADGSRCLCDPATAPPTVEPESPERLRFLAQKGERTYAAQGLLGAPVKPPACTCVPARDGSIVNAPCPVHGCTSPLTWTR